MLKTKLATLLTAGTLLLGAGITATTALADDTSQDPEISTFGNTGNTYWANTYKIYSPDDHTPARSKKNKSAYWNRTDSCNVGYITIWAALYDGRDVSSNHSYRSYAGDTTKLYNTAVENYGEGVSVRINSRSFNNGSASGVWSPDSK